VRGALCHKGDIVASWVCCNLGLCMCVVCASQLTFLFYTLSNHPQEHTWRASHHFCAEISGNCSIMYIRFIMEKKPFILCLSIFKTQSLYGNIECVLKGIFHSKRKISKPSFFCRRQIVFCFFYWSIQGKLIEYKTTFFKISSFFSGEIIFILGELSL